MKQGYIGLAMAVLLGLVAAGCGGGSSSQSTTTQPTNPVPGITSLSPSSATAGAAAQTLTITGTNFLASSTASYNGVAHTVTFGSSTQLTIPLSASDQATAGTYPVLVTNPAPGGGSSNAVNFTVKSSGTPASGAVDPSFFSMTIGFGNGLTWPSLPIGTLGEVPGTGWAYVEPENGQFNWKGLDSTIALARANGVTSINYNMHTTPQWAAAVPNAPCEFRDLTACSSPPASIDDWNNYVTALVTRYKGQINYYEVWDEADYSAQWSGTQQQLLSMAESAFGIIKSIDPNAQVLTPGVTPHGTAPITNACVSSCFLASWLQAGGYKYADGVTWHGFYCASGTGESGGAGGGECSAGTGCSVAIDCAGTPLLTQINNVRSYMQSVGVSDKPIFDTSGSWGKDTNLPDSFQQAAYVARWYILQAAAGVKIANWWGYNTVGWGTLTTSSGLSAAGQAYTTVNGWLAGATVTSPCALSGSIWTCGFSRSSGYQAQIVWSSANTSDSATSSYTPPTQFTQYRDLAGNTTSVTGAPIEVGMQPIILETGPPTS